MIAALMVYAAAVSLLFFGAALALEFLARALGVPTRAVWAVAFVASVGLSAAAAAHATRPQASAPFGTPINTFNAAQRRSGASATAGVHPLDAGIRSDNEWLVVFRRRFAEFDRAAAAIDARRLARFDVPLSVLWAVGSLLSLAYLAIGVARLRRAERPLQQVRIDGDAVLVSHDLGPALVGVLQPRIVVPQWVLSLPRDEQRLIIAHEKSHRTALDPALALAAAVCLALQPWNVALWAMLSRLRLAIEVDCDGRVLRRAADRHDARRYAEVLLSVYQRSVNGLAPRLALVERRSSLETRILRLTRARPGKVSVASGTAAIAAVLTTAIACAIPGPIRSLQTRVIPDSETIPPRAWTASFGFSRATSSAPVPSPAKSPSEIAVPSVPPVAAIPVDGHEPLSMRAVAATVHAEPPTRSRDVCGFGSLSHVLCSIDGTVVVRAVDDRHVIVGVIEGDARSVNDPVDHLFLVTAYHSLGEIGSRVLLSGHIELSDGGLRVVDPSGSTQTLLFVPGRDTIGRPLPQAELRFTNLSLSQYIRNSLTLAMIPLLTRSPTCEPADHLCYAIDQITVGFP